MITWHKQSTVRSSIVAATIKPFKQGSNDKKESLVLCTLKSPLLVNPPVVETCFFLSQKWRRNTRKKFPFKGYFPLNEQQFFQLDMTNIVQYLKGYIAWCGSTQNKWTWESFLKSKDNVIIKPFENVFYWSSSCGCVFRVFWVFFFTENHIEKSSWG